MSLATEYAPLPEDSDFIWVDRVAAHRFVQARIPADVVHKPSGYSFYSTDIVVSPREGSNIKIPSSFAILSSVPLAPRQQSDSKVIFGYHDSSRIPQSNIECISNKRCLTQQEIKAAVEYTFLVCKQFQQQDDSRMPFYFKSAPEIQVDGCYSYLILPTDCSKREEKKLEEGEVRDWDASAESPHVLSQELESAKIDELGEITSNAISALSSVIHGLNRYWISSEFCKAIPLLRGTEPSRLIQILATRDAFLTVNYEKWEWLGDFVLEVVAVDFAATTFDLVIWDREEFRFITQRISMNHRLWKAGLYFGLQRFIFGEAPAAELINRVFPFSVEGANKSGIASGKYLMKKKVLADVIEVLCAFYVREIGSFNVAELQSLLRSIGVTFPSRARSILPLQRQVHFPETEPPYALGLPHMLVEGMKALGYTFRNPRALYFAFNVVNDMTTSEIEHIKAQQMCLLGEAVVREYVARFMYDDLPEEYQEDVLTNAKNDYMKDSVFVEAFSTSCFGRWLCRSANGRNWPTNEQDILDLAFMVVAATVWDGQRDIEGDMRRMLSSMFDATLSKIKHVVNYRHRSR